MNDLILEIAFRARVEGINLRPGTLSDQWEGSMTLLVFLRHLG